MNPTTLFNAAPLMFVLLAEGSLHWRREKLREVKEAADQLQNLGFGHLSFAASAYHAQNGAYDEDVSISECDLFGSQVSEEAFDFGYDPSTNNPFADFLRECARKIDDLDVIYVDESWLEDRPLDGFPVHSICDGELKRITGDSRDAQLALVMGYVRLSDIPDELWADDCAEQRKAWLEDQFSAKHAEAIANETPLSLDELLKPVKPDGEEASQ